VHEDFAGDRAAQLDDPILRESKLTSFSSSDGGRYGTFTMMAKRSDAASDSGNVPCPSSTGFIVAIAKLKGLSA
jgi:hypothetical protein